MRRDTPIIDVDGHNQADRVYVGIDHTAQYLNVSPTDVSNFLDHLNDIGYLTSEQDQEHYRVGGIDIELVRGIHKMMRG